MTPLSLSVCLPSASGPSLPWRFYRRSPWPPAGRWSCHLWLDSWNEPCSLTSARWGGKHTHKVTTSTFYTSTTAAMRIKRQFLLPSPVVMDNVQHWIKQMRSFLRLEGLDSQLIRWSVCKRTGKKWPISVTHSNGAGLDKPRVVKGVDSNSQTITIFRNFAPQHARIWLVSSSGGIINSKLSIIS